MCCRMRCCNHLASTSCKLKPLPKECLNTPLSKVMRHISPEQRCDGKLERSTSSPVSSQHLRPHNIFVITYASLPMSRISLIKAIFKQCSNKRAPTHQNGNEKTATAGDPIPTAAVVQTQRKLNHITAKKSKDHTWRLIPLGGKRTTRWFPSIAALNFEPLGGRRDNEL